MQTEDIYLMLFQPAAAAPTAPPETPVAPDAADLDFQRRECLARTARLQD